MIAVGEEFDDSGEAGATVSFANDFGTIEAVFESPFVPDALDGGGGVDEDTVHVKEDSFATDRRHLERRKRFDGSIMANIEITGDGKNREEWGASFSSGRCRKAISELLRASGLERVRLDLV